MRLGDETTAMEVAASFLEKALLVGFIALGEQLISAARNKSGAQLSLVGQAAPQPIIAQQPAPAAPQQQSFSWGSNTTTPNRVAPSAQAETILNKYF